LSWQQKLNAANVMMNWWQWTDASTNQLISNYISQNNQANNKPNVLWPQTDTTNAEVTWNP
jgi:hypothetical protein